MLALLNLRNTPLQSTGYSPVEQIMSRKTRTILPTKNTLLKPKTPEGVKACLEKAKQKQALYYNRSVKQLPQLEMGETVRIMPPEG